VPVPLDRSGSFTPALSVHLALALATTFVLTGCASSKTTIVPRPDFGGGLAVWESTSPSSGGGSAETDQERAMREACFPLGFWISGSRILEEWIIVPALLPNSMPIKGQRLATSYECVEGQYGPYAHKFQTPFLPPPDN
jgi:hypothetical protein